MELEMKPEGDDLLAEGRVELVVDGDSMAVLGEPKWVRRFLEQLGLYEGSVDITGRFESVLRHGADIADVAAKMSKHSALWVKLTPESAAEMRVHGLVKTKLPGVSWAMLGKPGKIKEWIQIETGPGANLTNPAILTDLANIMGKVAAQREADAIRAYLERLDRKTDRVLRNQHAAQWAELRAVGDELRRAHKLRDAMGSVDTTTWSEVSDEMHRIYAVQGYALDQLCGIAQEVEQFTKPSDLANALEEAVPHVLDCLGALASGFELARAFDELDLDRALQESPECFVQRRAVLEQVREDRQAAFAQTAGQLMNELDSAAARANLKVLLHQPSAKRAVGAINGVGAAIDDFHQVMGTNTQPHELEPFRWWDAARSPKHLKEAGKEAGQLTLYAGIAAVGWLGIVFGKHLLANLFKEDSDAED